ncbi:multiple antibiotic resistance protein [Methanofollis sp. W23]|uniref:MarC family protein n=1 Tax=Methanofollis sp. W23 TaxID=2817849 RepID=UPI001AEB4C9D|nr:MarC family protein [Methanofollis sp. W23]MBP2147165.1 multiple antibiotic resistance protein [Methanofollis sp. W23]
MDPSAFSAAFFAALFAIANPVGNVPFFIMYTTDVSSTRIRHAVALLLGGILVGTMLVCMVFGSGILGFFGISVPAFEIAGAIILLTIAFSMLSGTHTDRTHAHTTARGDASVWKRAEAVIPKVIVPLVIPIYVGAGTISALVLYGHQTLADDALLLPAVGVVLAVCLLITLCNLASDYILQFFGKQGLEIVVRIFGIVIAGIAVQMFFEGLGQMTVGFVNPDIK